MSCKKWSELSAKERRAALDTVTDMLIQSPDSESVGNAGTIFTVHLTGLPRCTVVLRLVAIDLEVDGAR